MDNSNDQEVEGPVTASVLASSDHRFWFIAEPVPLGNIYAHPAVAAERAAAAAAATASSKRRRPAFFGESEGDSSAGRSSTTAPSSSAGTFSSHYRLICSTRGVIFC